MLTHQSLLLLGIIDKKRQKYRLDDAVITIDEVKDVDTFIEVEMEGTKNEINEKKNICKKILIKLGVSENAICKNVWLCDIATRRIVYERKSKSS